MEYYFFVIIVIIVLKILFWTFYFYVRAQRMRQVQTRTQRFIIVGAQPVGRGRPHPYSDRSAIIDHAEPVSATGPPPYAEAVKTGNCPLPPSYDQAMAAPGAVPVPGPSDGNHAVSAYNATTRQVGSQGISDGISATPSYIPANYPVSSIPDPSGGSCAMPSYNPTARPVPSQANPHSTGYPQPFGGQVAAGNSASVAQVPSAPPQ